MEKEQKNIDDIVEKFLSSETGWPEPGPSELTQDDVETWVKSRGWTPLEFLTHTYRNGQQRMEHRIAAAKAVLEYVHRKLPAKLEIKTDSAVRGVVLDPATLKTLSDKELAALEVILSKVGGDT